MGNNLTRIVISKYGKVSENDLDMIIKLMKECYNRLKPHNVSLVDLYVFEKSSLAEAFLSRERERIGVKTSGFEEFFFAMHDAWRGIPRIILCLDRLRDLPKLVIVGGVHHEVGHTILHGSIEYYFLTFPKPLLELMRLFNFSEKYATDLLYLASVAVKDYEVTRLLCQHGYIEDQAAFVKFLLKISEDDLVSWNLSQGNPLLEALYIMGLFKPIGCAIPLLNSEDFGNEIKEYLKNYVSHLPKELSSLILNIVEEKFAKLENDTLNNISKILYSYKPILDTLFRQ